MNSRNSRGSSPRMRGALLELRCRSAKERIIPADAGSTRPRLTGPGCRRDHPRGCGEHAGHSQQDRERLGSSPRMRGARYTSIRPCRESGIIPADAGSTRQPIDQKCFDGDHPRGCGEHVENDLAYFEEKGSSPRMRGARRLPLLLLALVRIIPADAGSTCLCAGLPRKKWDHPRGCGEHCRQGQGRL